MSLDFSLYYDAEFLGSKDDVEVGDFNITHNLGEMAREAGIYDCLWRSGENGFSKAGEIISLLENAIQDMKDRPEHYKKFNAENGWGTYEDFVPWVEEVLECCQNHPKSEIVSCR